MKKNNLFYLANIFLSKLQAHNASRPAIFSRLLALMVACANGLLAFCADTHWYTTPRCLNEQRFFLISQELNFAPKWVERRGAVGTVPLAPSFSDQSFLRMAPLPLIFLLPAACATVLCLSSFIKCGWGEENIERENLVSFYHTFLVPII